ncbi:MAG: hypothetical protein Q9222_002674 [Ikaeria aurantiellina]
MAINAKNLTYGNVPSFEPKQPAFLEKLRGTHVGVGSPPPQRPQSRPRRQPQKDEDADDDPVYVYDEKPHEPMTKSQYQSLAINADAEQSPLKEGSPGGTVEAPDTATPPSHAQSEGSLPRAVKPEKLAAIGGASKKRSARIIEDTTSWDAIQSQIEQSPIFTKQSRKKRKRPKVCFEDDISGSL